MGEVCGVEAAEVFGAQFAVGVDEEDAWSRYGVLAEAPCAQSSAVTSSFEAR